MQDQDFKLDPGIASESYVLAFPWLRARASDFSCPYSAFRCLHRCLLVLLSSPQFTL